MQGWTLLLTLTVLAAACSPAPESGRSPATADQGAVQPFPSGAPPATPGPTLTPPPTPSPSPSPAAVLDDRFGFLISDSILGLRGTAVRRESDPRPVFVVGESSGTGIAVSPDGRRLAYWTATAGSPDGPPQELRVLDVAPDARPRTLLTLATPKVGNKESGGHVVWSSDGSGLVIGVDSFAANTVPDGGPEYAALRLLEAAGGQPREIVRLPGRTLVPLAWDRQARLIAAYEPSGGGVHGYDIIEEDGTLKRTQTEPGQSALYGFYEASHDAQQALGLGHDSPTSSVLRVWPLASFARAVELRAAGSERILAARWRPGTAEIGVLFGDRLELWDASGARRPVPLPPFPPTTRANGQLVFRADGKAVFVHRVLDRTSPVADRPDVYGVAVDLASGRSTVVQMGGFFPGESVRVGP